MNQTAFGMGEYLRISISTFVAALLLTILFLNMIKGRI